MLDYYKVLFDNITSYSGSGLLFLLLLASLFFLYFKEKNTTRRKMIFVFPAIILAIIFCPAWAIYIAKRNDAVILYRLFWIIPTIMIVGYALVEAIFMVPKKFRTVSFAMAVAMLMLCGKYIYSNRYFSRAENFYHIPDTVVKICDEIVVPGREVRACFPDEHIQFVRQYTALVLLPYGRGSLFTGVDEEHNDVEQAINQEVVDSKILTEALRASGTQYLIVKSDKKFNDSLWNYDFCYVTSIDDYDIYLDNNAYLGLDMGSMR